MTIEELKVMAADVARAMLEADAGLPEELRKRFIAVRAELFQRGVFDPVLVRFDTATVSQASTRQIAEQLRAVAESLR